MALLYFFLVLAVSTTNVWAAQFFCVGVDCKNVTLYLGPRFGSKTIQLSPLDPNITSSSFNSTNTNSSRWDNGNVRANSTAPFWKDLVRKTKDQEIVKRKTTTAAPWRFYTGKLEPAEPRIEFRTYNFFTPRYQEPSAEPKVVHGTHLPVTPHYKGYRAPVGPLIPRVRPVLQDGSQSVDMTADDIILNDEDMFRSRDMAVHHSSVNNVSDSPYKGLLDFSNMGFSGEDVKEVLARMNSTQLSLTTRLMLNRDLVTFFPNLTFPVELEYSLSQLWMDDNTLRYLSPTTRFEITRLGNLKLLSLSNTSLTYLNSLYLPQLEVLYLKNNYLTEIPQGFYNLRQLHLTNNHISSIQPSDLASFINLRLLDLSGNKMSSIYDHPFMPLRRLETLYLQNNSLGYVSDIDVPHSAILFLGNNPLVCSCELVELVNQRWPQVVDKEKMNCTDDMYRSTKPVTSLGFAPCRSPRHWWRAVSEVFEQINRWCYKNGLTWHNIGRFLYWTFLIVAGWVVVKVLSKNFKIIRVPYNILDDKKAFADDRHYIVDDKNAIVDDNQANFENTVLQFSDKIAIINDKNDV